MAARTILIVDEDRDTRVILRTVFERAQFVVTEAAKAEDALAVIVDRTPDLVILNYPMRAADGRTLVQHLRAHDTTRNVPILNFTSRVVSELLEQAANEGVNRSLSKPIGVDALMRAVTELMQPGNAAEAASAQ